MGIFERFDEAERNAKDDEYIVVCEWQGRQLLIASTPEPHRLEAPRLVVVRNPKTFAGDGRPWSKNKADVEAAGRAADVAASKRKPTPHQVSAGYGTKE